MYKLSKKGILRTNKNFQTVYRSGKSYANRMLVLYVVADNLQRRVGFAAGKRLGNAVVRNRVKRLLREVYRLHQYKLADGYTLLLVGRQAMVKSNLNATAKAFMDVCTKAKILK